MSTIIKIYTDGACKGNPGPGGWGAVLISNKHRKEIYGGELNTTNNRMELSAVINALKIIKISPSKIIIYTDSKYVQHGVQTWIHSWKKNNWKTSKNTDVKNSELWKELDNLTNKFNIEWVWVKSHSGNFENERADSLANKGVPNNTMGQTILAKMFA